MLDPPLDVQDWFTSSLLNGAMDAPQGKKKKGVFTYSSGGRYIGELQGGRRHGRGSFLYPDGSSYEGQWQDNVKHGEKLDACHTLKEVEWYQKTRDKLKLRVPVSVFVAIGCVTDSFGKRHSPQHVGSLHVVRDAGEAWGMCRKKCQ